MSSLLFSWRVNGKLESHIESGPLNHMLLFLSSLGVAPLDDMLDSVSNKNIETTIVDANVSNHNIAMSQKHSDILCSSRAMY